jgi:hypothetical protein
MEMREIQALPRRQGSQPGDKVKPISAYAEEARLAGSINA